MSLVSKNFFHRLKNIQHIIHTHTHTAFRTPTAFFLSWGHMRKKEVDFEMSCIFSVGHKFCIQKKPPFYLLVMRCKVLHCQEIPWCSQNICHLVVHFIRLFNNLRPNAHFYHQFMLYVSPFLNISRPGWAHWHICSCGRTSSCRPRYVISAISCVICLLIKEYINI
jgi:hypothetical protein